jgi:hypothetical protein
MFLIIDIALEQTKLLTLRSEAEREGKTKTEGISINKINLLCLKKSSEE